MFLVYFFKFHRAAVLVICDRYDRAKRKEKQKTVMKRGTKETEDGYQEQEEEIDMKETKGGRYKKTHLLFVSKLSFKLIQFHVGFPSGMIFGTATRKKFFLSSSCRIQNIPEDM